MATNQIKDLVELKQSFREIILKLKHGDKEGAEKALKSARILVNISTFLEPHAKAILTSFFAEISSILDPLSKDCDILFDNFIKSMEFIYGSEHIVLSDCYTMLSSFYSIHDRIPEAINVRLLPIRSSSLLLFVFLTLCLSMQEEHL